jgi:hypothetical protein
VANVDDKRSAGPVQILLAAFVEQVYAFAIRYLGATMAHLAIKYVSLRVRVTHD